MDACFGLITMRVCSAWYWCSRNKHLISPTSSHCDRTNSYTYAHSYVAIILSFTRVATACESTATATFTVGKLHQAVAPCHLRITAAILQNNSGDNLCRGTAIKRLGKPRADLVPGTRTRCDSLPPFVACKYGGRKTHTFSVLDSNVAPLVTPHTWTLITPSLYSNKSGLNAATRVAGSCK